MKNILLFVTILGITQMGCKKSNLTDPRPTSLDGKWKMITVKDNATGLTTTKPTSIQRDVDITFTSTSSTTGTFIGNTPSNEIWQNDYIIGSNQSMSIPRLSMTKVGETPWGNTFLDNIRSSLKYSFESGGRLDIITISKTLIFYRQ
jgi:hypothetical protein